MNNFHLTSNNFSISTLISTLETEIFMSCEPIYDPIQQPKLYMDLEMFVIVIHTLTDVGLVGN